MAIRQGLGPEVEHAGPNLFRVDIKCYFHFSRLKIMKAIATWAIIGVELLLTLSWARGQTWAPAKVNTNYYWSSIAGSADGTQWAATAASPESGSGIYLSTNSGAAWFRSQAPAELWAGIASSADGTKLAAVDGSIYLSTNSGSTWQMPLHSPSASVIASSADGSKLLAASSSGYISVSTNSGGTWFMGTNIEAGWSALACAADGSKMAAVMNVDGSPVFVSTNCGVTWASAARVTGQPGAGLACSADGSKLMLATGGRLYVSTNWGTAWASTNLVPVNRLLACSADASVLLSYGGQTIDSIYTSTNLGATWTSNNVPQRAWAAFACSADGNELLAAEEPGSGPTSGGIWILQTPPSPQLNFTAANGNLNFFWTAPSTNMVLEESPDLSNWMVVTNEPVLNDSNLQEQVTFLMGSSNGFFRLVSP
jgi:hypothetical protein